MDDRACLGPWATKLTRGAFDLPGSETRFQIMISNHKHDPATLQTLCFNSMIQGMYLICFET